MAQQHAADVVRLQVHHHGHFPAFAFNQFACFHVGQPVDAHHAVAHLEHAARFFELHAEVGFFQLQFQYVGYFAYVDFCHK